MTPEARFFWWIAERHRIFEKRRRGLSRDWWTEDEILRTYRFTNPYRENDRTTVWFRENIRDPLKDNNKVLMATVIFRWFNLIQTGETLVKNNLHIEWDSELARQEIKKQDQYVTGAYIIKTPDGKDKVDGVIWCIEQILKEENRLISRFIECPRLEMAWEIFQDYPYLGAFMSYELVTDLRWTHFFQNATDIMRWANAGPGAMRGLNRIHGRDLNYKRKSHNWNAEMYELLQMSTSYLGDKSGNMWMPKLEMREIEHSLCEFDKYERVRNGEGRPRGKFP